MYTNKDSILQLRSIDYSDVDLIVDWRNRQDARDAFFSKEVVTPDTHNLFIINRKPHDLVWIVELKKEHVDNMRKPLAIGTVSLTVDVVNFKAEFGRLYIPIEYRNDVTKYAYNAAHIALTYGFEMLRLNEIWADVKIGNKDAIKFYERFGFVPNTSVMSSHDNAVIYTYTAERWAEIYSGH
jgi:RimJ/RimL family protein N-acetyltransferase